MSDQWQPPESPPPGGAFPPPGGGYPPPGGSYPPPGGGFPPPGGSSPWGAAGPGGFGAPPGPKPSNNLVWAILATLFCCLPLGIAAIVFSTQVDSKWNAGDYEGALKAAKTTKTLLIVSVVGGVIVGILYFLLVAASVASST